MRFHPPAPNGGCEAFGIGICAVAKACFRSAWAVEPSSELAAVLAQPKKWRGAQHRVLDAPRQYASAVAG